MQTNYTREFIMYGQWALDWQEQIDFDRMRKEHLERVREVMRKSDLEAIIAFLPDNIRYIDTRTKIS